MDVSTSRGEDESAAQLTDFITNIAKVAETALAGSETARAFSQNGGTELLLHLMTLPKLPSNFASFPASNHVHAALRAIAPGGSTGSNPQNCGSCA